MNKDIDVAILDVKLGVFLFCLIVIIGVFFLIKPSWWYTNDKVILGEDSFNDEFITKIESKTGLVFLDETIGLRLVCFNGMMDPYIVAKLKIPTSRVSDLLLQIQSFDDCEEEMDFSVLKDAKWWNDKKELVVEQKITDRPEYWLYVILTKRNESSFLYIYWQVR